MRTSERHHLKHNELADLLERAGEYYTAHRSTITYIAAGVVVALVAVGGYIGWRQNVEARSRALLAEAMVVAEARVQPPAPPEGTMLGGGAGGQAPGTYPTEKAKLEAALPKLLAAADAYPGTDAALTARYQAASTLVQLGRFDEAVAQYDHVMAAARGVLSRTARLGKAEAQLLSGKHEAAIATFKALSEQKDGTLPVEALLMELARAYRLAGKTEDARKTLTQIVEQHADSPFAAEAKQELEKLGA